jgi:hypothetical protein
VLNNVAPHRKQQSQQSSSSHNNQKSSLLRIDNNLPKNHLAVGSHAEYPAFQIMKS